MTDVSTGREITTAARLLGRHFAGDNGLCAEAVIGQDRSSGLCRKPRSGWPGIATGDYWYSTKQTSMVIQGLTDYLTLSGELANSSDVEVLVNGASVGKRHFGRGMPLPCHGRSRSGGASGQRRTGDDSQERQRHHVLVGRKRVVLR